MEKKSPLRPRERTLCAMEPQPNTTRTSVPAHSARNSLTAGLVTRHAPQRVLLCFLMLFILTERRGWCSWHSQAQPRTHYHQQPLSTEAETRLKASTEAMRILKLCTVQII